MDAMKIDKIEIYNLKIPFKTSVEHSLYRRNETESVIVIAYDRSGNLGAGEGTPRSYVTGELLSETISTTKSIARDILDRTIGSTNELLNITRKYKKSDIFKLHPSALCAVELSLLDLWAKSEGRPIYKLFDNGIDNGHLTYSGVIPFVSNASELIRYIELVNTLKLKTLKVKITDPEIGISQLKIIREKLGSELDIRVDINAAFSAEIAIEFIRDAHAFNISAVEQPVAKEDLSGLKKVSENSQIPIIADESMYTQNGPEYLIDNDICHGLNIRISSCGGFGKAYRLYQKAIQKKMVIVLGAHVGETAILSFAGRHLALICPDARYLEGSFSKYLLAYDLVDEDISFGMDGKAPSPQLPGLGIQIDRSILENSSDLCASIS
jgi:muconate cycloisomerase